MTYINSKTIFFLPYAALVLYNYFWKLWSCLTITVVVAGKEINGFEFAAFFEVKGEISNGNLGT